MAENKVGEGVPGPASQPVTAKDPWEKPGRPGVPDITAVDRNKIALKWAPPKSDGGSPIFNYVIEYRVEGQWQFSASLDTQSRNNALFRFGPITAIEMKKKTALIEVRMTFRITVDCSEERMRLDVCETSLWRATQPLRRVLKIKPRTNQNEGK